MSSEQEDVFYYLTVMNENYVQPPMPGGRGGGHPARHVPACARRTGDGPRVQLLGSGTILREVIAGADLLERRLRRSTSDVWSVTSFTELRRDGLDTERWNRLHPTAEQRQSFVETAFGDKPGPFVAATDYMRAFADQIRPFVPGRYAVLGTDGFGRSDYRVKLRQFFEVDRYHVAVAALKALADDGVVDHGRRSGRDRAIRHRCRCRGSLEALSPPARPRSDASDRAESVSKHPHGRLKQRAVAALS